MELWFPEVYSFNEDKCCYFILNLDIRQSGKYAFIHDRN